MKIFGRDFKKHHAKRLLGIVILLICIGGTIDYLTRDYISLTGTLYSKSYSTGKHDVTFRGHYVIHHNGQKITESVSMYESDWNKLVENKSTRQFNISEAAFQNFPRHAWGNVSAFLLFVGVFAWVLVSVVYWLITDEDGNVVDPF